MDSSLRWKDILVAGMTLSRVSGGIRKGDCRARRKEETGQGPDAQEKLLASLQFTGLRVRKTD